MQWLACKFSSVTLHATSHTVLWYNGHIFGLIFIQPLFLKGISNTIYFVFLVEKPWLIVSYSNLSTVVSKSPQRNFEVKIKALKWQVERYLHVYRYENTVFVHAVAFGTLVCHVLHCMYILYIYKCIYFIVFCNTVHILKHKKGAIQYQCVLLLLLL